MVSPVAPNCMLPECQAHTHTPGFDSTCGVQMCKKLGFSLFLFLCLKKNKKTSPDQREGKRRKSGVIGSYVDAQAVWPRRGTFAASSGRDWPQRVVGWGGGPRPRSYLRCPSAPCWTAPWPAPGEKGGRSVLRRGWGDCETSPGWEDSREDRLGASASLELHQ